MIYSVKILNEGDKVLIEQIAPESYGVIAAGRASKLPQRIQEAIKQVQPIRLENKESE
jgi:hypothetical protein